MNYKCSYSRLLLSTIASTCVCACVSLLLYEYVWVCCCKYICKSVPTHTFMCPSSSERRMHSICTCVCVCVLNIIHKSTQCVLCRVFFSLYKNQDFTHTHCTGCRECILGVAFFCTKKIIENSIFVDWFFKIWSLSFIRFQMRSIYLARHEISNATKIHFDFGI